MTRRIRSNMRIMRSAPELPGVHYFIMTESPRVSSKCANRPDIWEWRMSAVIGLGEAV